MPEPSPTATCLSDAELVDLVDGRLAGPALDRIKDHVAGCNACAGVVGGLVSGEVRTVLPSSGRLDPRMAHTVLGTSSSPADGAARRAGLGRGAAVGRYLVLSLIGRGGMGEVYEAYDPQLDRRVALKLLHARSGADDARRLTREARALGRLSHPNVVQVHDVGEHEGDVFVAMELVEGQALDAWCEGPPRPGWREVLAAYRDAARGLAAAHAKGIVHRDVKPSNILRGKDGRVRVADFGLAAGRAPAGAPPEPTTSGVRVGWNREEDTPLTETIPAPSDPDRDPHEQLTATGALLGTPLYMAPEQFEGPGVGPASDQYSLCTALYEGLHGELPFRVVAGPGTLLRLLARKKERPPPAPPPGSPVPAGVHRAIVRGLAPRPEDRFPSMDALADALREEPAPRRPRGLYYASIAAALAIVAAVAGVRGGAFESPCAHPERQLAGAWDDEVRGRVGAALRGTGRSYAGDTADRVAQILDRYTTSWASTRGEVCEASRRGSQRREIVGLRDECLDRRLGQVQALTALLGEKADVQVLDKAVEAAAALPPLSGCADTEALTARVRPPEDPALRARVAALEPRVDRLEALWSAGKYKEGVSLGEALSVEAGEMPYAPLRAQLQYWMGRLREGTGDYDAARDSLRDAAASAAEGRDDELAASAWTVLLFVVGERQQRPVEAAVLRSVAPVVVRTRDARALASWLKVEGLTFSRAGRHAEAKARYEQALAFREKLPDILLGSIFNNLGNTLANLGDPVAARTMYERALAISDETRGPDHPENATGLNNLGDMLSNLGEYASAKPLLARSLSILEASHGPDHALVGYVLTNLGRVSFRTGDDQGAAAHLERAVAIFEKTLGPEHPSLAYALVALGRSRVRLGQLDAAEPLLTRALAQREEAPGASPAEVAGPLLGLAELTLARGKRGDAVRLLDRALSAHDPELEADIQLTLAEALWPPVDQRARARALVEQARAHHAHVGHRPGEEKAARWLAEHPL